MYLVDSHCHLHMLDLSPEAGAMDAVVKQAQTQGIGHILNVSVKMQEFPQLLAIAKKYPFVSASVGLHPNETDEPEVTTEQLIEHAKDEKVVGIGETGLDYYRSQGDLAWQQQRFRTHIQAAKAAKLPLIVHSRQAPTDTIAILQAEQAQDIAGVMHCFTEDWNMATAALDLGFYISFSGIVTFKNAVAVQDVAERVPLDRMLLETDAPFLAPEPQRGKPNFPAYVAHTAAFIAKLRGMNIEEVATATTDNFFTLFSKAKRYV